jgi:hypothetical protein
VRRTLALDGVELVLWLERDAHGVALEAVAARPSVGELRFAPGAAVRDGRGGGWEVEGALAVLDADVRDGVLRTPAHPDALARAWAALTCPTAGEVLLSAAPGWEFQDWGGQGHVGGGSHGSLRGEDSEGALVVCGLDVPAADRPGGAGAAPPDAAGAAAQWSICDVAPLVLGHFGLAAG